MAHERGRVGNRLDDLGHVDEIESGALFKRLDHAGEMAHMREQRFPCRAGGPVRRRRGFSVGKAGLERHDRYRRRAGRNIKARASGAMSGGAGGNPRYGAACKSRLNPRFLQQVI